MSKKWDAIRGSAEFYITMAVCLVVIGVSGYFLLFGGVSPEERLEEEAPAEEAIVTDPAPEVEVSAEEPVVETIAPEPVETPAVMPEVEIDDTPVVAEIPRQLVDPLEGEVVTAFSMEELVYNATLGDWRTHDGVDIAAEAGTSVLAASSGTVISVEEDPLMGTTVVIEHDGGYQTTYSNLQAEPSVAEGDTVSAGQIIGTVGDTAAAEAAQGPHLHFSVTCDGEPVDPQSFLNQ